MDGKPPICSSLSLNGYFVYAYKISRLSMLNFHKHLRYVQIFLDSFYLNLRIINNPQHLLAYKSNIKNCCSWAFHHANGSRHSSLMTFHILKWINCFFIIDKVMFTLVSMRSYKLVNSIVWDVKLGAFSFTLIGF
jgi:hypothetical protein